MIKEKFINYFDKTLIVVGHKSSEIKEYLKVRHKDYS